MLKTNIKKQGDTVVVSLDGQIDFETYIPLAEDLKKLVDPAKKTDSVPDKIIFNFQNLEFVGSSGISAFVKTLREFNERAPQKPRYCHVKSEFRRIIKAFDEQEFFEFYDTEDRAKKSFDQ